MADLLCDVGSGCIDAAFPDLTAPATKGQAAQLPRQASCEPTGFRRGRPPRPLRAARWRPSSAPRRRQGPVAEPPLRLDAMTKDQTL